MSKIPEQPEARRPRETRLPRIGRLARLPAFLALDGKRAVLAGGGEAASWKAELLASAGATAHPAITFL